MGENFLPGMKPIVVIKLHCDKLSQQAVSIEESKVDHIKQEDKNAKKIATIKNKK